ncbi:MAG TPA: TRAP transporter small permease [Marinobacterium sp.]|nr:TRAP transporter small permease [Marinobacterium sp.]
MWALTNGWLLVHRFLRGTSIFVLALMMLSICYDAVMRYLFAAPTSWTLEVNSFLLVYLAVMGAAEAQRADAHIRIGFFAERCSPRKQAMIACVIALCGILFASIMVWRGGIMAYQAFEYGERVSSAFGTPMVIPFSILPVGFGALAIQLLIDLVTNLNQLATHKVGMDGNSR